MSEPQLRPNADLPLVIGRYVHALLNKEVAEVRGESGISRLRAVTMTSSNPADSCARATVVGSVPATATVTAAPSVSRVLRFMRRPLVIGY